MYRIMLIKSKKDNDQSLFQFLTTTVDGVTSALEIETQEALDARVESMLNNGYAKSDFIIVRVIDYTLAAGPYSDDPAAEAESSEAEPASGEE